MKAVVFGGSGFLGSHVADALSAAGHEVTLYDRKPSAHLKKGQRFIQEDILNEVAVREVLAGQEVAYNFAGLADLDEAQRKPVETVRMNILGNAILLEAACQAKLSRYIFASSVYVSGQSGGFYRASKQACEGYIEEYERWFGLNYTILRYGSIYGRRANHSNGVRMYLTQALRDRHIVVEGTGDELREYVHVSDVSQASVQVLLPEFQNQRVILTGHHPLRVRDLLEMIREMVGSDVRIEFGLADSAHYAVTPYTFRPEVARKLVNLRYVDMGQGLLDCLEEIHQELSQGQHLKEAAQDLR